MATSRFCIEHLAAGTHGDLNLHGRAQVQPSRKLWIVGLCSSSGLAYGSRVLCVHWKRGHYNPPQDNEVQESHVPDPECFLPLRHVYPLPKTQTFGFENILRQVFGRKITGVMSLQQPTHFGSSASKFRRPDEGPELCLDLGGRD